MKQFRLLLTILTLLAVGSMNAWAETKTITLTYSSFGLTTSYKQRTATIENFGFTIDQGYKGSANNKDCIQMNSSKGSGILYNTTPIPGLKSITVNVAKSGKTYTITTGTTSKPTTSAGTGTTTSTINVKNSGDTYFQLKVSGACYFSSIVITYEKAASCTTSLAKPTGLNTSNITATTADLSWTAVPNATEYQITYGDAENPGTKQATATGTTYTLTNLTPQTGYIWAVKAIGDGATYCDSEDSQSGDFTTAAPPQYTITWSVNGTTSTTQVTEGNTIGTLLADPSAPSGCSDKVFVGWTTTNIGAAPTNDKPEFITANTIPTGNTTYYAVFATKANTSGSQDIVFNVGDIAAENNWNNGTQYSSYTIAPITITYSGGVNDGKYYSDDSWRSYKNGSVVVSGSTISEVISSPEKTFTKQTDGTWKYTGTATVKFTKFTIKTTAAGSSYTDYITECVDCTAPAEALALTLSQKTANLGQDGNAVVTFSTTGGNGTAVAYAVTPTTGATLSGTTITFTQEGTYTLTASQSYTTTNGTTYCGGTDSKTITITKAPVFGTATIDQSTFAVSCGDTTAMNSAATITLGINYNLTKAVTVTAPEGFLVSTNKTDKTKYAASVTLTPAASGSNQGKITNSIYVRAYSAVARTEGYSGNITLSGDEITTQTIAVSSTVTCQEYTLTLNDRGSKSTAGNYYAGAEVPQPADPTGVCTDPINYVFDGWATAEVAEGSTTYTKVSFPYTMPNANTTLYAVYKYTGKTASKTQFRKGKPADLTDGQKVVIVVQEEEKALNSTTYQKYYLTATSVTINNDLINDVTNAALIWEVKKDGDKYSFLQNDEYLNITESSTHYNLTVTSTKDSWSIASFANGYSLQNTTYPSYYAIYALEYNNFSTDAMGAALQFYVPVFVSEYTTSPACGPRITGTGDIAVTSAKGIWVEAVTSLAVSAQNLDKNEDGANVTIAATALTDGFTLKTSGTNGSGSKTVTLATGYSNSTYSANLVVVYTPSADNIIEEGKIALRVYKTGGITTYATDTITVRGHSLPAEFVVAAKTTDGWVALPSDLGTGSSSSLKAPYSISVDNETHPTKATEAPKTAVYSAADRSTKNTAATGIRLKNANGLYLQGSTAQGTTNIWLSSNNSEQAQSWELRSSDFSNYFVRLQAAESGRYLSYDATQGKIGNYKQTGQLRLLPVEKTCVRYDAPAMDVFALKSSAVTLRWLAIEGATGYEYSMDNEVTWNDCAGITATATEVKWTLDGLTANAKYTLYVRVKVANGETNCSASDSETFTTTTCDDVPVDLWVSATANTATITWRATAATATIRIYADEQGATLVKTEENASSPCKIVGLEQNTHYYYQVLADGSCASAIANFRTESNEVSIVEWEKEAVIVDLNTEITGADEVSILVENQHTHGTSNQNIADDLFFSKYYEATGSVKLVAIYNGTKDTLSLKDMTIKIGTSSWTATQYSPTTNLSTFGKKKTGFIAPNEEIIIWTKGTSYDYSRNNGVNIVECIGDKMDASVMVETNTMIFGGQASIGLFRGTELIDIIGALDEEDDTKPLQGSCKTSWGDEKDVWCGAGLNIEDPTQEIELSTNRCLLVRSNAVKSGKNAVTKNRGAFNTLTKEEWLGRQVIKTNDTGDNYKGSKSSCEGFAYVADFNYNDYYTTYDSVANLEIKGNRNEDGTYTIPVPKLDTMACTNLRLQLKKNGTILATREEKVPIIIDQDADTKNATFFGDKLTDEICKTCDVVIRDKAQLSHTEGGKRQFRDMYVYTGSSLLIPAGQAMSLDKVRMFATNDSVSYAIVNNGTDADAAISVKEVSHVKRIDGRYWYPFSLPYDCNIADIGQLNGQPLGVYGMDWGIKYYDGQRRQSDGNSETTYGEVSKYWTMMPEDGLLKAYTGYIIGLFVPAADEPLMKSVNFPPATESAYTESADSKQTTVTNWADNLSADKRHHGWNFVGSPYISLFGATEGEGLYNNSLKMGCTDRKGEQQDKEHIYVSIPDGGNKNTYTQSLAEGVTLRPFTAYFVQAVDPTNGQSNTLPLTYSKTQRLLLAPQRLQETEQDILVELTLANGSTADNAGLWVGNSHTNEYEIGRDLTKMYSAASKPQLYTVAPYGKMAYQALPDAQAHAIPLGIYVPAKGDYTLSLNRAVSRVNEAQSVCLLYNGKVVADLLQADYTLSATGKGLVDGYTLDIRRAPKVETDIVPVAGDAPYLIVRDGILTVANLPAEAMVQVYDVLGRICFSAPAGAQTVDVVAPQTGVYTVVVTTGDQPYILKTLLH
mgnify:CR=1 FL=1